MTRLLALLAFLALGSPAFGATVAELRTGVSARAGEVKTLEQRQRELQKALDTVAARIESLKAARQQGGGDDAELDGLLKRSQQLSTELTELLRARGQAEDTLRGQQAQLVGELDLEIAKLRKAWEQAGAREAKAALIPRLKALRSERDALRQALPATLLPKLAETRTDDADELIERADAMLDSEDKLRREEKALADRITQLRNERDLDRRMNDFLGESNLFDEHDRRISISRQPAGGTTFLASPTAGKGQAANDNAATPPPTGARGAGPELQSDTAMAPSVGYTPTADRTLAGNGTPAEAAPNIAGPVDRGGGYGAMVDNGSRSGQLTQPPERRANGSVFSDDESLEQLEARRAKLEAMADTLHQKAEEATKRAKELQ